MSMKILFAAPGTDGGSEYYRLYLPAKYLADQYLHNTAYVKSPSLDEIENIETDVVVHFFQWSEQVLDHVRRMRDKGVVVIYALDDDIWNVPDDGREAFEFWTPERIQGAEEIIKWSSAVVVSTEALKKRVDFFNSNVIVIPNYVETPTLDISRVQNTFVRIGWAGSQDHASDFTKDIVSALLDIVASYPVDLIFCGWIPPSLIGKARHLPGVPPKVYMDYLNALHLDIAIAPLTDTRFNRCKSNLKFLEYAVCGIPGIYSNVEPYKQIREHQGMVIENTYDSWFNALETLIQQPGLRANIVKQARKHVYDKYLITKKIRHIASVYEQIAR